MTNRIKQIYLQSKTALVLFAALLAGTIALVSNLGQTVSFIHKYNPFSKENSVPPIEIGMSIADAEKILGKPQEVNLIARSYFSHGIEINPDYEFSEKIGGITVKTLPSGFKYKGQVDGIRLGSPIEDIKANKGNPTYWGIDSPESSIAIWYKEQGELLSIVQFKPNKEKVWVTDSITYTKAASIVAYRAILLSVFQELKAGRVSKFAEELAERGKNESFEDNKLGLLTLESFASQYLHQDFEFIQMNRALGGGVELYLIFNKKKLLYFWIYPLGWTKPTVRVIADPEILHKKE